MAAAAQPTPDRRAEKSAQAFRTISEVATELDVPQHVLRFWESKFAQVRPLKRGGGRRYYRPEDVDLLRRIRGLLYDDGYTIKGVQRLLREQRGRALAGSPFEGAGGNGGGPRTELPRTAPPVARAEAARPDSAVKPEAGKVEAMAEEAPRSASALDPAKRRELEEVLHDLTETLALLRAAKG